MLEYLHDVEKRLPKLLKLVDEWHGKLIVYEKPMVERLWMQDGDNRIYLHRIHSCAPDEAYYHQHSWPSAIRVVKGQYEMKIGSKDASSSVIMIPKSSYEMTDPKAFHSVRPLDCNVLSLMVTGPLYEGAKKVAIPANPDLPSDMANQLLADFRKFYKGY